MKNRPPITFLTGTTLPTPEQLAGNTHIYTGEITENDAPGIPTWNREKLRRQFADLNIT